MKIVTKNQSFVCTDMTQSLSSVSFAVAEEILELGETVELQTDEGFVLYETSVAEWLRWTYANGILTLTNTPEPEPVPEPDPEPTPPTEWDLLQQKVTQMELDSIEQGQFATDLQLDILTMQIDQKGE